MVNFIKALLQLVIDFIYYIVPRPTPRDEKVKEVKLVAHRGWHGRDDIKENTMASFEAAIKHKLYGIEFDIRWTKDLVPIIHHDMSLAREWQKEINVCDVTFAELREHCPEVPSLAEVVETCGGKIHFFIELKEEHFPKLVEQKKILAELLAGLTPIEDFHIICLSMGPINLFDMFSKPTYLLVAELNIFEMSSLAQMHKIGGVTGHYVLCSDQVVAKHRKANQKVGTGFIRSVNCLNREINRDIDWIFTNHPWSLLPFIESVDSKN